MPEKSSLQEIANDAAWLHSLLKAHLEEVEADLKLDDLDDEKRKLLEAQLKFYVTAFQKQQRIDIDSVGYTDLKRELKELRDMIENAQSK
jgi:hypothetical protein